MSGLLLGRVRGIEVRIHWSVAVIAWLLTWSLASNVFPSLSPGSTEEDPPKSPMPMMESSLGTGIPRARAANSAPCAITSLVANIAVGHGFLDRASITMSLQA